MIKAATYNFDKNKIQLFTTLGFRFMAAVYQRKTSLFTANHTSETAGCKHPISGSQSKRKGVIPPVNFEIHHLLYLERVSSWFIVGNLS